MTSVHRALLTCVALASTACTSSRDALPDAATALPSCASEGCGDENLLCTSTRRCRCPRPDGQVVECEALPSDAGTETDAPADVNASGINDPRIGHRAVNDRTLRPSPVAPPPDQGVSSQ